MTEKVYQGAIVLFTKVVDGKRLFLVADNTETRNITFISGAKEDEDLSLEACAQREISEELGLAKNQYTLMTTDIYHNFVFGPKKKERAGHKGSYLVFLAKTLEDIEISPTQELKSIVWMDVEEVVRALSFPDLKEVFMKVKDCI